MEHQIKVLFNPIGTTGLAKNHDYGTKLCNINNIFVKYLPEITIFTCLHSMKSAVNLKEIQKSEEIMLEEIPKKIGELEKLDDNRIESLHIIIAGHCITAASAGRFSADLKKKLNNSKITKKKIKIELIMSDPSLGIKKGWIEKHKNLPKNKTEDIAEIDSTLFYTMGGGFFESNGFLGVNNLLNRKVNFNPQAVNNATRIVILGVNHNDSRAWRGFYGDDENAKTCKKLIAESGVYFFDGKNFEIIKKENSKDWVERIYKFTKGREKERITILTNIIAKKLKIPPDELCGILIEKTTEKNKFGLIISKISKTFTISGAFNIVFELFEPGGIFFGYVNKDGKFYKGLKEAKKCVAGFKSNHEKAIGILEGEKNKTKFEYKKTLISALIARIRKWYNLKNPESEAEK